MRSYQARMLSLFLTARLSLGSTSTSMGASLFFGATILTWALAPLPSLFEAGDLETTGILLRIRMLAHKPEDFIAVRPHGYLARRGSLLCYLHHPSRTRLLIHPS